MRLTMCDFDMPAAKRVEFSSEAVPEPFLDDRALERRRVLRQSRIERERKELEQTTTNTAKER